jgi:hypothetical protein
MQEWIHKYPGVQALLQQPDDVLSEPVEHAPPFVRMFRPYYILEGHIPVAVDHVVAWRQWCKSADRSVALTQVGDAEVSTIFLGLDHNVSGEGMPVLFETMAFHGRGETRHALDDLTYRYATWEEAEQGHAAVVAAMRAMLLPPAGPIGPEV